MYNFKYIKKKKKRNARKYRFIRNISHVKNRTKFINKISNISNCKLYTNFHQLISFPNSYHSERHYSKQNSISFHPSNPRIRIKPFGALNFPRKTHSFQSMHEHSVSRLDIHYQIDAVLSSVTSSCTPTPMPALQRHSIKNHPSDSIKSRAVFIHSFSLHPSLLRHQEKRRERIR